MQITWRRRWSPLLSRCQDDGPLLTPYTNIRNTFLSPSPWVLYLLIRGLYSIFLSVPEDITHVYAYCVLSIFFFFLRGKLSFHYLWHETTNLTLVIMIRRTSLVFSDFISIRNSVSLNLMNIDPLILLVACTKSCGWACPCRESFSWLMLSLR